jgi:hypothetical protein
MKKEGSAMTRNKRVSACSLLCTVGLALAVVGSASTVQALPSVQFSTSTIANGGCSEGDATTAIDVSIDPNGFVMSAFLLKFSVVPSDINLVSVTAASGITASGVAGGSQFSFGATFSTNQTDPFSVGTITVQGCVGSGEMVLAQQTYTDADFNDTNVTTPVTAATVEGGGPALPMVQFSTSTIANEGCSEGDASTAIDVSIDPNGFVMSAFLLKFSVVPSDINLVSVTAASGITASGEAGGSQFSFGATFSTNQTDPFSVGTITVQGCVGGGQMVLAQQTYTDADFNDTNVTTPVVAAAVGGGGPSPTPTTEVPLASPTPTTEELPSPTPTTEELPSPTPTTKPVVTATATPTRTPTSGGVCPACPEDDDGCQIGVQGHTAAWLLLIPAIGLLAVRRRRR